VPATLASFGAMRDWGSRARLLGVKIGSRLPGWRSREVSLRPKALDGAPLTVRAGTTDMNTIFLNYLEGAHLPPAELTDRDLSQICELGSQIGTGLAGLAARYRNARILGVEPDPTNAALARRNVEAFGPRCQVVETAIWDSDTDLTIEGDPPVYSVRPARAGDPPDRRIGATTVDRLLAEHMPEGEIDYMIMQLEKTEPRVLAAAATWAPRVASIRVEIYPGMGFEGAECVSLLEALGYEAWWEPTPSRGYGFGIRR
jgi:FkbM family methyltransferase